MEQIQLLCLGRSHRLWWIGEHSFCLKCQIFYDQYFCHNLSQTIYPLERHYPGEPWSHLVVDYNAFCLHLAGKFFSFSWHYLEIVQLDSPARSSYCHGVLQIQRHQLFEICTWPNTSARILDKLNTCSKSLLLDQCNSGHTLGTLWATLPNRIFPWPVFLNPSVRLSQMG